MADWRRWPPRDFDLGGPGKQKEVRPEVSLPPQAKAKVTGLGWGCPLSSEGLGSGHWSQAKRREGAAVRGGRVWSTFCPSTSPILLSESRDLSKANIHLDAQL